MALILYKGRKDTACLSGAGWEGMLPGRGTCPSLRRRQEEEAEKGKNRQTKTGYGRAEKGASSTHKFGISQEEGETQILHTGKAWLPPICNLESEWYSVWCG